MNYRIPVVHRHEDKESFSIIKTPNEEVIHEVFLPMDNIAYVHTVFAQCFFPYQAIRERRWQVKGHNTSLLINAGELPDPERHGEFKEHNIPSGAKSRLLMAYIQTQAIKNKTRLIDMGGSMRKFMKYSGVKIGGKNGNAITREVHNIAASTITVGKWADGHVKGGKAQIADGIDFWLEKDESQHTIWQPEMQLSPQYFDVLQNHRMPINWAAYIDLQSDPRAQDIYMWMCYRMQTIKPNSPLTLKYSNLNGVFGSDRNEYRFWEKFTASTIAACKHYPQARVQFLNDCVQFFYAPSPIPPEKAMVYLAR